jgi:hypothetical protein
VSLPAVLTTATAAYAAGKGRAEAAIATRRWATGLVFGLLPFRVERGEPPAGRLLRSAPAKKAGACEFGFDAAGRLVVVREHTARRGHAYETFIDWDDRGATAVRYDLDPAHKAPSNAARLTVARGQPTRFELRSRHGRVLETYRYQGDRLIAIHRAAPGEAARILRVSARAAAAATPASSTARAGRTAAATPASSTVPAGRAAAATPASSTARAVRAAAATPASSTARAVRAAPAGPTLAAQLAAIEDRLFALTPAAIQRAAARSAAPLWCCGLVFDSSDLALPPELAIATVDERAATLRQQHGATQIWKCTAFDGLGAAFYQDRALARAVEQVQPLLDGAGARVRPRLVRLAQRLNALPRARFGTVAPEFVVYAFDRDAPTMTWVAKSLRPAQRAALARLRLPIR